MKVDLYLRIRGYIIGKIFLGSCKTKKTKTDFSTKKGEDCQGNLLGEGIGATPPTSSLFRHAEGVEG
jgi:hypothetical protein